MTDLWWLWAGKPICEGMPHEEPHNDSAHARKSVALISDNARVGIASMEPLHRAFPIGSELNELLVRSYNYIQFSLFERFG